MDRLIAYGVLAVALYKIFVDDKDVKTPISNQSKQSEQLSFDGKKKKYKTRGEQRKELGDKFLAAVNSFFRKS